MRSALRGLLGVIRALLFGWIMLLNRYLQHAAKRPVVALNRRWGDAGRDLVVQPVLDLIGG